MKSANVAKQAQHGNAQYANITNTDQQILKISNLKVNCTTWNVCIQTNKELFHSEPN